LSIYAIAKLADVPYRRAHAHLGRVIELCLMRKRMDDSGPRKIARPYTMQ
jgi:hypothetical protein